MPIEKLTAIKMNSEWDLLVFDKINKIIDHQNKIEAAVWYLAEAIVSGEYMSVAKNIREILE